jgi:hypothetical protein
VEEKANLKMGLPGQEPGLGIAVGGNVADTEEALAEVKEVAGGGNPDYDDEELEGDTNKKGKNVGMDMRPVAKAKIASDKQSEELTYDEPDEDKREARRNTPAGEKSLLQKSFETLESKVIELKSQGIPAESALREIQPAYNALGESIKKSLSDAPVVDAPNSQIAELTEIVKSLAGTVATLQQSMSTEIATLKAQTLAGNTRQLAPGIPMPRSLNAGNLPAQQPVQNPLPGVPDSFRSMAFKSTFVR